MGDMQGYYFIHNLHKKYGRYVRVGSNTLSITDPLIMQPAYGAQAKAIKGEWYDGTDPVHSMQSVRDRTLHDRRRRVWAPGFSDKALREYEPTVHELNEKLANQLGNLKGQPANMSTWFNLYGFDVMSRLAFGRDYGMVESGKRHWALDLLTEGIQSSAYRLPCWVFRLIIAIPGGGKGFKKFLTFCIEQIKWRVENKETAGKDVFGWLLKAYANEPHPEDDVDLQADARLIILAGSDTTSATLTYLFYRLAKEPGHIQKLREELRPLTQGEWSDKDISHAKHLNGVINETLRLHPAVPSGLMRKIVKEGAQIGDVFLPGETGFFNPFYAMGRDEGIYEDAQSFVPERWYSKPEMVKYPDAFAPFSMGSFNCIGKNLARMELRTLTTHLLLKYDVAFAPGEDGTRILTETHDHFTLSLGQLDLIFTPATS
ncbi:hypothetical protein PRZ48_004563 [Zasmidium cellare]|uniref:Cytochrome P450 n=1 Tax=Zasmidium cellare TaxID=395010 RepID=A0ABR0ES22_ZASCE|nr:hypothetical protein PRZ48_004563 [Zasmidium cellare]